MCASIPEAETEEKWSSPFWALSVAGRKQPSSSLLPLQLWTTEQIACKIAFLHVCKALSTAKVWLYNWRADINIASKEEISTGALCEWWKWPLPFQSMWRMDEKFLVSSMLRWEKLAWNLNKDDGSNPLSACSRFDAKPPFNAEIPTVNLLGSPPQWAWPQDKAGTPVPPAWGTAQWSSLMLCRGVCTAI